MSAPVIDRFLRLVHERGASDLHLSVGRPPSMRLHGRIEPIPYRAQTDTELTRLLQPGASSEVWNAFQRSGDADFAYELCGVARFRVNLFRQERGMGAVFRIIPSKILTVEQLGLPSAVRALASLRSGLVLVTGPTGSGKSTTLASLVNEINGTRSAHIVTIEDPIEFVHPTRSSVFSQREIGTHSNSFSAALRAATREDPDVILVGEMRDLETVEMALRAAATGLLVLGTLHTNSAAKTVDRIINVFPTERQPSARGMIGNALRAVVAQQLLPRKGGGRVPAFELLNAVPSMATAIREGKTHQLASLIQMGKRLGMMTMDESLKKLVVDGVVDPADAFEKALGKDDFRKWMKEHGDSVPPDVGED